MSTRSSTCKDLYQLECFDDFLEHSVQAINKAKRSIAIFSDALDPNLYEQEAIVAALSRFARGGRHCQIQILVRRTEHLVENGHALVRLSQRLPSKILLRKITTEPTNKDIGFLMMDQQALVYKHSDLVYRGFVNYNAKHECKSLQEIYTHCWELGVEDIQLKRLYF